MREGEIALWKYEQKLEVVIDSGVEQEQYKKIRRKAHLWCRTYSVGIHKGCWG